MMNNIGLGGLGAVASNFGDVNTTGYNTDNVTYTIGETITIGEIWVPSIQDGTNWPPTNILPIVQPYIVFPNLIPPVYVLPEDIKLPDDNTKIVEEVFKKITKPRHGRLLRPIIKGEE